MEDSKLSTLQQPESSDGNLLVIDADGIAFLLGWVNREHRDVETMHRAIDQWVKELFLLTAATSYIGILASSNESCFRYQVYRYRPYKGNRIKSGTEGNEWIEYWEPIVRQYLKDRYGFQEAPPHLETDDVVAHLGEILPHRIQLPIICSPDKDLKQIAGYHLDYRKVGLEGCKQELISVEEADYRWCMQMLTGDSTDHIAGVPGLGEKKAALLLKEAAENGMGFRVADWKRAVKLAYLKYFGDFYGEMIYQETEATVTMMHTRHPMWESHKFKIDPYLAAIRTTSAYDTSIPFQIE